jgi:SPP1 family predicted phage head-tail adaptor
MSVGRMSERITISKEAITYDSDGFSTAADTTVCTVWAEVDYRHGSVQWRNRAEFSGATVLFTIRYRDDIAPGFFVLHDGKKYAIESAENVANRKTYTELLCSEVVPSGEAE